MKKALKIRALVRVTDCSCKEATLTRSNLAVSPLQAIHAAMLFSSDDKQSIESPSRCSSIDIFPSSACNSSLPSEETRTIAFRTSQDKHTSRHN